MSDTSDEQGSDPLGTFRAALGGWARRVGELAREASGQPAAPAALREPLLRARTLRRTGDHQGARAILREELSRSPGQVHLVVGTAFSTLAELTLGAASVESGDQLRIELEGSELGSGLGHLLGAALMVGRSEFDAALDELRRALRGLEFLPAEDEAEARLFAHLLGAEIYARRGQEDRALRELHKARVRLPAEAGGPLVDRVVRLGVELSLVAGRPRDAQAWIRGLCGPVLDEGASPFVRRLLAETLAAAGDHVGAHAVLETLPDDEVTNATHVRVGLALGVPEGSADALAARALAHLQRKADDAVRLRLWALAELAAHTERVRDPSAEDRGAASAPHLMDALLDAHDRAAPGAREKHLHELAHVALRLDLFADRLVAAVERRLTDEPATAAEELRLVRARHRLARGDAQADEDFVSGPPAQFLVRPEVGGPWGPDAQSPVRQAGPRQAVLVSQRALAAAEYCLARDQVSAAQDHLVAALVEAPAMVRARVLLAELARPAQSSRLEDVLAAATAQLAAIPSHVLGISLAPVERALAQVVAARERLARPLTIAIMGEFSSGKSTFVNALLGQAIAPMGVLPTTTTINVFRRGTAGGARVHYRDGRVATLVADEVAGFLHGLDELEASRIHHVEIERGGSRLGDAAVVDTPGLNALDMFHEQVARQYLDEADAVVWVFSATRSGAASEAGMLASLRESGRQVLGVLNKVDTLDEAERVELGDYLREQLGEVLVDVVPVCARGALAARTGSGAADDLDEFAPAETALERHFLSRARELKRRLTARRLAEAVEMARACVQDVITALEERAAAASRADEAEADPGATLREFAEHVRTGVLELDDPLLREALGLGIVRPEAGLGSQVPDQQDVAYLESLLDELALEVVQRGMAKLALRPDGALVMDVLERRFVPWARGYLEGECNAGFVDGLLGRRSGRTIRGEAAIREELRTALTPMATAWRARALDLAPEIARLHGRRLVQAASQPRAEAVRLRAAVRAGLDALIKSTEGRER